MTPADFRAARQSLGLTQAEFARMLGYSASGQIAISNMERGVPGNSITPQIARLVAAYLDGYRPADWPQKETSE